MTSRKSKRELERVVEDLEANAGGSTLSFAEFYEWYYHCIEVHGSLPAGPSVEEYVGRETLSAEEGVPYWKRLLRVWDGEEEPPCDPDEWEWREP